MTSTDSCSEPAFQAYFSYLTFNVQKILIDGGYTCNAPSGQYDVNCFEATMDTEWSLAMANSEGSAANTAKVYVYEAPNAQQGNIVNLLNVMLNDGYARVMSNSWNCQEGGNGCPATYMAAVDYIYTEMVGKGWTLLSSSGDWGSAAGCGDAVSVAFPGSDPNVVDVGGTLLYDYDIAGSGPTYEEAWGGGLTSGSCSLNEGGSTGGFSGYFHAPSYQASFNAGGRAVPDMALEAGVSTSAVYLSAAGGWTAGGGTSVAAPKLAGFFAQENAYLLSIGNKCGSKGTSPCAPLGNANYALYDLGFNESRNPFYDTLVGCGRNDITQEYNLTYYCAEPGYDLITGFGSANMLQLAWAINWEVAAVKIYLTGPQVWAKIDSWTLRRQALLKKQSPTSLIPITASLTWSPSAGLMA